MLLSQKIHQLKEDVQNKFGLNDELSDGFNRCLDQAESNESKLLEVKSEAKELLAYLKIHDSINEEEGFQIVSRLRNLIK